MNYKKIKFIGGGRWASIVLKELLNNFDDYFVDWYKRNNKVNDQKLISYLLKKRIFLNTSKNKNENYQKIIIASHSLNHLNDLKDNIKLNVPILIEKPIFKCFKDFQNLELTYKRNIFFNLEYFNAYYIEDLKTEIDLHTLKNIQIIWHDPIIEKRNDSIKFSEVFTSIFCDQLLHVLSILKRLGISAQDIKFKNLITSKKSRKIEIVNSYKDVEIYFSISRFSKKRERKIIINNNLELDFAKEPLLFRNNELNPEILLRDKRRMPIAATLEMFLEDNHHKKNKLLSIDSFLPEIKYCFTCQDFFKNKIQTQINKIGNKQYLAKIGLARYIYFLGIRYYELNNENKSNNIHFHNGYIGLKKLVKWGHKLKYLVED